MTSLATPITLAWAAKDESSMQGRAETIAKLHRKYAGVLYDKCLRMLSDPSEAEDAVQETFVNAYRHLDSFVYGDSHLPWLYRIATNVCLKFIRTRSRKGMVPTEHIERVPGQQRDPVAALQRTRLFERLVGELDKRTLEIVVAHYIDGMDQGQIAQQLGISRRAVVKRLTALRKQWSATLEEVF
jgi:RNA polymerase sigma-70 factor (ECF subfamily)